MANKTITELDTLTTIATGDFIPVVDVSDTTQSASGTTKKITQANFVGSGYVTLTGIETLTNKTLTSPVVTNASSTGTDAGAETLNNKTLTRPKIVTSIDDANGNEVIIIPATASAVNEVTITNAATGNAPDISATGGDTNIDLTLTAKGTGKIKPLKSVNFGAFTAYFTETDNGNSSTADTIDWTTSNKQKSTLTDNCTFTFTAPPGPCNLVLKLVQDGTGSRTVTWPAAVHWSGAAAPTLTTTANRVDIITFYYDGTTYFGASILNFVA